MVTLLNDPQFRLYAICCLVLTFIVMFLSAYTGATRGRTKSPGNPEDARLARSERVPDEHPEVIRVIRAHRNALENIPLFFALGLVCVLAGASPMGIKVTFIGFTAARVFHMFFHLKAMQPWRSISYGIGAMSLLGMMALIGIAIAA